MKWLIGLFFIFPFVSIAQEHDIEEFNKHNRVSIVMGHTHVPKGVPAAPGGGSIIVASWGLNYEYWFNKKWGIGLHNDMEIATYLIESSDGSQIQRSRPVIISLVGIYNPWKGLEFLAGVGREFEEHHDFWVYRFGVEYEIEIGNHWDLAPAFVVDIKENLYDSFTIGLVIGKRF